MLAALHEVRKLRVVVYHPKDREQDELIAQLRRIGCNVTALWPPSGEIPRGVDVVFMLFRHDGFTQALIQALAQRQEPTTIIGVVEFESPAVIEAVVNAGASAVVTKPIRPFGLLTSLVLSRTLAAKEKNILDRVRKLESKLVGFRRLEKAKSILIARKGMSEEEAYEAIRKRAMSARVSVDVVCSTIIDADEFVGL